MQQTPPLGKLLKELRVARHLSQGKVAELTGTMEQPHISAYERGVWKPSPDRLRLLAKALGVPYERLAVVAGYADAPEAENVTTQELDDIEADIFAFDTRPALLATLRRLRAANDADAYARALRTIHRFLAAAAEEVRDSALR